MRHEFDPDWKVPLGEDAKVGRLDRIGWGDSPADFGKTRVWADWLPWRPGTREPYFPAVPGYTFLGVGEFSCPNDIEGEKQFSCAVYRNDLFVAALIRTGFLTDEPSAIFEPSNTEANAQAAVDCEFVLLPPIGHTGKFTMGSPPDENGRDKREGIQHAIHITRPFLIGRTAVTQRVWQAVMGSNPSHFQDGKTRVPMGSTCLPVESVSWEDITAANGFFACVGSTGLRLPSEAEWEYACRAGTQTPVAFGATIKTSQVNFNGQFPYGNMAQGEYRQKPVAVGSLPANAFGLFEMHGNVCEWCQDHWTDYLDYEGAPMDGSARSITDATYRVFRGGSWIGDADYCRSAHRFGRTRNMRISYVGFRPVQAISD